MNSEYIIALILGLVEGLTEYLPISSTGHMIIVGHYLEFTGEKSEIFEVSIQLGAILAVLILFKERFFRLFDFKSSNQFSGLYGLSKLAICCMPVSILGLIFHKKIKLLLFNPTSVAITLIIGGIILVFIERHKKEIKTPSIEEISYKKAFLIGIFQCLSLIPGASRSGSMIVGGLILGLTRVVAAEFSFLVAVPIMFLATGLELYKNMALLDSNFLTTLAIGLVTAFISAFYTVKFFLNFLRKTDLKIFGYYRIILGIVLLILLS